jgi:hypothetical protein
MEDRLALIEAQKGAAAGAALIGKNGLSEPAPMTAPVPFWMEGNSSNDFGLANDLQ